MIETLISKFGAYLAAGVALMAVVFGIYKKGKTAARNEIKADTVDKIIEVDKKEREIDENIANDSNSDRRDRLRKNASDAD